MPHVAHPLRFLAPQLAALRLVALVLGMLWLLPASAWAQSAAVPPAAAAPAASAPAAVPAAKSQASASAQAAPAGATAPTAAAAGATPQSAADTRRLDEDIQGLKKDVVDLNRDLFVLEEELLFPANTQVAVFVSMDVGDFFALDSVTLKIDNKEVTNYLYTPREVEALPRAACSGCTSAI